MEAVYVHLSFSDVVNEVRTKAFGLEEDKSRYEPLIKPLKCPRCGSTNEPTARYCTKCNMPISEEALVKELEKKQEQEDKIAKLEERLDTIMKMLESKDRFRIVESLKQKKKETS